MNRACRCCIPSARKNCSDALAQRILIIDGAMGTMLQSYHLDEDGYRGERFAEGRDAQQPQEHHAHGHACDLKGNNDLLSLTQPDIIKAVHMAYLDAGADLVETNTFNATRISQSDYQLEHLTYELNREGARLARECCDAAEAKTPDKPRFVIGVLGPTSRTASISPDVNNPGFRNVSFEELAQTYIEATRGLIDGGADVIMVETIFDTLNAKAALYAIDEEFRRRGARLPIMISGTITDLSGRTLSGQTPEAFYYSLSHARPLVDRPQLRARCHRNARLCRCAGAGRRSAMSARIRTPACRTHSANTTRRPSRWRQPSANSRKADW